MAEALADVLVGGYQDVDCHGLLHHRYSLMVVGQYKPVSITPIPTGDATVRMQFDPTAKSPDPAVPSHCMPATP